MTSRLVYEGVLVELNKVNAPSLLLEDFNYLFNKAIYQYINKRYNIYDINQQTTDDIRVLKSTCVLSPIRTNVYGTGAGSGDVISQNSLFGATYEINLPSDYLHLLNCVCNFYVHKKFKCYDAGTYIQFGATRLTSDLWSQIINNFYMRPSYKRPYYYIHNVNTQNSVPTNPVNFRVTQTATTSYPTGSYDSNGAPTYYRVKNETEANAISDPALKLATLSDPVIINGIHKTVTVSNTELKLYYEHTSSDSLGLGSGTDGRLSRSLLDANDLVERNDTVRYGNASQSRIEIRYGKDNSLFELANIYVDYIKSPQHIRLTQEQLDLTEDTSQIMEFPDYVCQEIINELVKLVMENSGDPRLQSNIAVNLSIANPVQQLQETK